MFFIFGSPRSGTTLLAQSLDAHPDLVVPSETDFIIPASFVCDRIADPALRREILKPLITGSQGYATSLGEHLDVAEVHALVDANADAAGTLFSAIYRRVAEKAGARLAGDKSPNDLLFLRMLIKVRGILPETKVIHIVRDVRDVLASLIAQGWSNDMETWFPRFWNVSNLYLYEQLRHANNYHQVRYEDLVADPERVLSGVCRHLGVAYDPIMLDHTARHPRYRAMQHHQHLFEAISGKAVGRHRVAGLEAIMATCLEQCAEGMETFGYRVP